MAIKVGSQVVINDSREIGTSSSVISMDDSVYDNFHPNVTTATNLDLTKAFQKITLTSNLAFTVDNNSSSYDGHQCTILLDRGSALYTPTFASNILFPSTPSWGTNRYWTLSFVSWRDYQIRATAIPFDAVSAPSSSFSNFDLSGWDTSENSYGVNTTPWAAVYISFAHQAANNRVAITYTTGNSRTGSVQATTYANYTGLTGITSVQAQYNVGSQAYFGDNSTAGGAMGGPLPTDDGYSSGSYYTAPTFAWYCESDSGDTNNSQTNAIFNSGDPDFRIKIVCNEGTFYSTAEVPGGSITVFTNYGTVPEFSP